MAIIRTLTHSGLPRIGPKALKKTTEEHLFRRPWKIPAWAGREGDKGVPRGGDWIHCLSIS